MLCNTIVEQTVIDYNCYDMLWGLQYHWFEAVGLAFGFNAGHPAIAIHSSFICLYETSFRCMPMKRHSLILIDVISRRPLVIVALVKLCGSTQQPIRAQVEVAGCKRVFRSMHMLRPSLLTAVRFNYSDTKNIYVLIFSSHSTGSNNL